MLWTWVRFPPPPPNIKIISYIILYKSIYYRVYRIYLSLFLLSLLFACAPETSPPAPDYGEKYFQMECYWFDPSDGSDVWRCTQEEVDTSIISGDLVLQLSTPTDLYFCGENLVLRSEITVYDNLIAYLTKDKFGCLHITEDKKKGNEFDWMWEQQNRLLQIIWRPEIGSHKMTSLVIEDGEYYHTVSGIVYYKTLSDD